MSTFMHAVGFGLVTSAVIALSAVALSLQFSVSNIPNFAHGEFLTLACTAALVAQYITNNVFIDVLVGAIVVAIAAWLINRAIIEPFNRRWRQGDGALRGDHRALADDPEHHHHLLRRHHPHPGRCRPRP